MNKKQKIIVIALSPIISIIGIFGFLMGIIKGIIKIVINEDKK